MLSWPVLQDYASTRSAGGMDAYVRRKDPVAYAITPGGDIVSGEHYYAPDLATKKEQ